MAKQKMDIRLATALRKWLKLAKAGKIVRVEKVSAELYHNIEYAGKTSLFFNMTWFNSRSGEKRCHCVGGFASREIGIKPFEMRHLEGYNLVEGVFYWDDRSVQYDDITVEMAVEKLSGIMSNVVGVKENGN